MKRIFRKNQIVVAALALLIAGAGYLNYTYENDEKDIATMAAKDSKEEKAKDTEATASLSELWPEASGAFLLTTNRAIPMR